jgi:hypothetical protein
MNVSNGISSAIIGALLGGAASTAYLLPKIDGLKSEIDLRPPVIVVDPAKLAVDSVPVGAGKAAIDEHFRNSEQVIKKFSDAGFIVIHRASLLSVPDKFQIHSEDMPINKHLADVENEQ